MRVICTERRCGWRGLEGDVLQAANPFDVDDQINGCPKCHSVDSIVVACDEPDCWQQSTCGTPVTGGYRQTCGKHVPKVAA